MLEAPHNIASLVSGENHFVSLKLKGQSRVRPPPPPPPYE